MSQRALPSALKSRDEIGRRLDGRRPAVFLDYDGTLSPIAPRPEMATLPEETREVVRRLAQRYSVGILSGRGREDVTSLVGLDGLSYAGSHGYDIAGPGFRHEVGEGIPARIDSAAEALRRELSGLEGVLIEPKRFAISIHFRLAREEDLPRIERAVDEVASAHPGLRKAHGKKLFELRPDLDWDKGQALLWMMDTLNLFAEVPIYLGDDVTDEDAFRVIEKQGIGILVAEEPRPTAASYGLRDPGEVRRFLEWLADR
ncbi:MAG: trehalose 6-phosphate phosphatase [Acidobacteriota bacterium]|nr:trehalose 6-phosphate phosphatase [Acidobacteriota bacterium]